MLKIKEVDFKLNPGCLLGLMQYIKYRHNIKGSAGEYQEGYRDK